MLDFLFEKIYYINRARYSTVQGELKRVQKTKKFELKRRIHNEKIQTFNRNVIAYGLFRLVCGL